MPSQQWLSGRHIHSKFGQESHFLAMGVSGTEFEEKPTKERVYGVQQVQGALFEIQCRDSVEPAPQIKQQGGLPTVWPWSRSMGTLSGHAFHNHLFGCRLGWWRIVKTYLLFIVCWVEMHSLGPRRLLRHQIIFNQLHTRQGHTPLFNYVRSNCHYCSLNQVPRKYKGQRVHSPLQTTLKLLLCFVQCLTLLQ